MAEELRNIRVSVSIETNKQSLRISQSVESFDEAISVVQDFGQKEGFWAPTVDEVHEHDTLDKVRKAMRDVDIIGRVPLTEEEVTWMISSMQNAGILFRERT